MGFADSITNYQYLGAIHIHSKFSDGSGDINVITKAAKKAGLDWVIVTDHNCMEIEEGFINGVCVIKGEEISPVSEKGIEANHYLVLGTERVIDSNQPVQDYVEEVRAQGGFGFAAHPDESLVRNNSYSPIRWQDKSIIPDGVEIWNWFSMWGDFYSDKNIFTQMYSYFFRHKLVTKPCGETLKWWDSLNNKSENIVPAVGGVDAHAMKIKKYIIPLVIFPYEEMFKSITNVITLKEPLSEEFDIAKSQILCALREGRNLIINRKVCSKIPEINICKTDFNSESGCVTNTCITIKLAKKFDIKILCDGNLIWSGKSKEMKFQVTKSGKYRIEIESWKYGYVYTNPILVK